MTKKSFFRERTAGEIQSLKNKKVYRARGLIEIIDRLDLTEEGLILSFQIIPGRFYRNTKTDAEASRKCYKHGDLIILSQPQNLGEALSSSETPLSIRARDFSKLSEIREEEINYVGYSHRPVFGRDKTKRVFPFVWMPEGARLWGYAENMTQGVKVEMYKDAKKVKNEGASVAVEVPSRTRKKPRYKFKLLHVPVVRGRENLATVLSLKPDLIQTEEGEIERNRVMHDIYNIKYAWERQREGSSAITFYPHDIAGYLGIIKQELQEHNMTPMEMNPFALPSRHQAEFYKKLCNNILIFDFGLRNREKLRKLHLAEKSILIARAIGKFGHDDFSYWNVPRDGKLKDYNWKI